MRDFLKLLPDCPVEFGAPVAVHVYPYGAYTVEVPAAPDVFYETVSAFYDNEWIVLEPVLHLGEGVPYVAVVEIF